MVSSGTVLPEDLEKCLKFAANGCTHVARAGLSRTTAMNIRNLFNSLAKRWTSRDTERDVNLVGLWCSASAFGSKISPWQNSITATANVRNGAVESRRQHSRLPALVCIVCRKDMGMGG